MRSRSWSSQRSLPRSSSHGARRTRDLLRLCLRLLRRVRRLLGLLPLLLLGLTLAESTSATASGPIPTDPTTTESTEAPTTTEAVPTTSDPSTLGGCLDQTIPEYRRVDCELLRQQTNERSSVVALLWMVVFLLTTGLTFWVLRG